jgi:hypothetical protein
MKPRQVQKRIGNVFMQFDDDTGLPSGIELLFNHKDQ